MAKQPEIKYFYQYYRLVISGIHFRSAGYRIDLSSLSQF